MNVSSTDSCAAAQWSDSQDTSKTRRTDFQSLDSALQSGDLASAQQAFAQLQQDSPRLAQAISAAPSDSDSPRIADLKALGSALQSGDLSAAQQAMTSLQQAGQAVAGGHHHHHHAAPATDPSTDSSTDSSTTGSVLDASA